MKRVFCTFLAGGLLVTATARPVRAVAQSALLSQQPTLVQEFQKVEDQWSIALVNKDQFGLENLLAPTYIEIAASGAVATRNQSIADTLAGLPVPLLSAEQKVVNVRVMSDVAIVEGTYMFRRKMGSQTRDDRGIFTHVYQRSHNAWSCVNGQRTMVVDLVTGGKGKTPAFASPAAGPAQAPAETAGGKKSGAALPFHIPLLYKGDASKTPQTTPPVSSDPPQ